MSSQWLALQQFCSFDLTQIRTTKARNKIYNAIEKKKRKQKKKSSKKPARKDKEAARSDKRQRKACPVVHKP